MEKLRDLEADLAICEAATPGPWEAWQYHGPWQAIRAEHYPIVSCIMQTDTRFITAAREGWPHAIHRALEAEERVDRLEHELRMLQDHLNEVSRPYGHYTIDHSS